MEEPNPVPQTSQLATNNSKRPLYIAIALGVLVIAAIAATVFLLPKGILTKVEFVYTSNQGAVDEEVLVFKGGALVAPDIGMEGVPVEYVRSQNRAIALVRTPIEIPTGEETGNHVKTEVYVLGDAPEVLTNDGVIKRDIALSNDGNLAAYTYINFAQNPAALVSPSLASWNVRIVDIETREVREVGTGTAPQFVSSKEGEFLVFASDNGLTVYNLAENIPVANTAVLPVDVAARTRVSDDGSYLLYRDETNGRHSVFAIASLYPVLTLEPVGQIGASLKDAVIVGDRIFGLTISSGGVEEVRSFAVSSLGGDGAVIQRLPEGAIIDRITPQR